MSVNVHNLDFYTYKELQVLAKTCFIPANIRKEQLVRAIKAHYEKDEAILQSVLDEVKTARIKRKKTKVPSRSRQSKDKTLNDGSEDNVDSTSGGTKDLVPYNRYVDSSLRNDLGVDQNYHERQLYPRHSSYVGSAGQYDSRFDFVSNGLPSNQLQSNYMASSNSILPYNGLQKDTMQNYSEYHNSNYPSLHTSSYYRQSCPTFSWLGDPSPYYSTHESFYASQLPPTKLFEPKIVIDCAKSYGVSKSAYYGAESNGVPSMVVDCSSDLLPNVPQLEAGHESHVNVCSPWSQNSIAPTYPNRVQFSPADMYSYQQNGLPDESYNFPAADNESISAEVDSASDGDNRSLADDIADLLNLDNMDQDTTNVNLRMPSQYPPAEQRSSTLSSEQTFYMGSNRGDYASANSSTNDAPVTPTWPQSTQNVENADRTGTLPGSQISQIGNNGFQLPTFSTLLCSSNTSTTHQNGYLDYQSSSHEPRDFSHSNCLQPTSQSSNSSCAPGCSQESGYAGTESSSNNGVERVEDISYQDDQSQNDYSEIIDLDASPEAPIRTAPVWHPPARTMPDTTLSRERSTCTAIEDADDCDGNETCDEDVEIVETQPSNPVTTRLVSRNEATSQTAEASGLIYKKETLHRSKIICDSTATNNIKENVVHQYVKIFIPTDGKKAIIRQTTTRKKISDNVSTSSYNAHKILREQLETRACWYKSVGCTFEAKAQVVALHEKKCKFQAVYCPTESCSWREAFNGLIEHINDVHKDLILDRQQFLYTIDRVYNKSDRSFYTYYQNYKDIIYVIRVHIDQDKCVATVQYIPDSIGNSIRARNLRGIMEFVAFPDKRRVKIWKGFIQPYSDTVDKHATFNTMRIEVGGSDFIVLYVCIC